VHPVSEHPNLAKKGKDLQGRRESHREHAKMAVRASFDLGRGAGGDHEKRWAF
jgi:hypothetical protein